VHGYAKALDGVREERLDVLQQECAAITVVVLAWDFRIAALHVGLVEETGGLVGFAE